MKLDLHGYTIHEAWKVFKTHMTECYLKGVKKTVIVTGHGAIQRELPMWCSSNPYTKQVTVKDKNPGAFTVKIKKSPAIKAQNKMDSIQAPVPVDISPLVKKYKKIQENV